ncbi:hypothetical protein BDZ94DRAFT_407626 [Collybia nuda]|uniref:Uncharacterized protein n=1 Tax=Collybia nuda TaxID=64659 RepID=A0A9P5Y863_9AGAR|nr:hypothetical protein BDZ94DRAFT_407626 [Collybia nuda]
MDDGLRCPVFCVADIPASTLDVFLVCTEERMKTERVTNGIKDASERVVIIDTEDLSKIVKGSSVPVGPFVSPFIGKTIEEVGEWFSANIARPERTGYMHRCFVVLDAQSDEDETCIVACIREREHRDMEGSGHSAEGAKDMETETETVLQSLRCDFYLGVQNAVVCEMGQDMGEGVMGSFMRSGMMMTEEGLKRAESGGLYIEHGEVKLDQAWRDFLNW